MVPRIVHAARFSHARRKHIEAVKVNAKDVDSAPAVALMEELFATDRAAREKQMSHAERHELRLERAPEVERPSTLLRLLLALSSKKEANNANDKKHRCAVVDGSLHIKEASVSPLRHTRFAKVVGPGFPHKYVLLERPW